MANSEWWQRKRVWQIHSHESRVVEQIAKELEISTLLAKTLCSRGIVTPEDGKCFLQADTAGLHDPFIMNGMELAASRVNQALEGNELILVHGDYDADGVSATALLVRTFRSLGGKVETFLPHRIKDGYGVSNRAIRQAEENGVSLLITCDCGTGAVEPVSAAKAAGMDVIVVDHHEPPEELAPAYVLLNPRIPESRYPFKDLCAAGVAFKLACAVLTQRDHPDRLHEAAHIDLAALGTVADVVPILDENRSIVRLGLEEMALGQRAGLRALKNVARLKGQTITAKQIAFNIAPHLNAACRIDDPAIALDLLLSDDKHSADVLAQKLNSLNIQRQQKGKKALEQAKEAIDRDVDLDKELAIVLADHRWHPGIVGIIAGRLAESFHRPALVIALNEEGEGTGSARSIPGFHLADALKACSDNLIKSGGHALAAGLTIREEQLPDFQDAFNAHVQRHIDINHLTARIHVDAEANTNELSLTNVKDLNALEPCGFRNPRPVFALLDSIVLHREKFGRDKNHLKVRVRKGDAVLEFIGWRMAEAFDALPIGGPVDVCFTAGLDEFQGKEKLELLLKDFRTPDPVEIEYIRN